MTYRLSKMEQEFPAAAIYCAAGCERRQAGCSKSLLSVVQRLGVFDDSKTFVDLPVLSDRTAERVLAYWDEEFGRIVRTEAMEVLEDGTVASEAGEPAERVVRGDGGPFNDFEEVKRFMVENFEFSAGGDTLPCAPDDLPSSSSAAAADGDDNWSARYRRMRAALPKGVDEWARELTRLWSRLCRRTSPTVLAEPNRFSFLPVQHPFIVAGGRFRECYYWDTYFIVRGLLVCGMWRTACACVENLLDLVERFGFVPNGARIYYLNRSQPPMLSEMVCEVVREADARHADFDVRAYARRVVPLLEREYAFFMNHRRAELTPRGGPGGGTLNRYDAPLAEGPRPESYREDAQLVEELQVTVPGDPRRERLLAALTASAESGWDFSSRWCADGKNLRTLRTQDVVPVCLNSILLRYERNLAWLHRRLAAAAAAAPASASAPQAQQSGADAGRGKADAYERMARERAATMQRFMYNAREAQWFDFDLELNVSVDRAPTERRRNVCASNFFPLWAGILDYLPRSAIVTRDNDDADNDAGGGGGGGTARTLPSSRRDEECAAAVAARAVAALQTSGLVHCGGVAATLVDDSGLQWDYPNAWPPVQLMLYEGLERAMRVLEHDAAHADAYRAAAALRRRIGLGFLKSMYRGWQHTGEMYEKYDARHVGESGGGGEYKAQVGFGWSNGVALVLLEQFATELRTDEYGNLAAGAAAADDDDESAPERA